MFNDKLLRPMLLKEVAKPFDDEDYIYELKFDGIRALIYVSKKVFKIVNRHGKDITNYYPELKNIQKEVGDNKIIFDGEIVAFLDGYPSFQQLQFRSHLKSQKKILRMQDEIPVCFVAFDVLYFNKEIIDKSLLVRKEILNSFRDTNYFVKSKEYSKGKELFAKVKKLNLEGIVAKKKNSSYEPNTRSDVWVKIKNFKKEEFNVHGYIFNTDKYSLLLGEYRNKKLYYVGKVSVVKDSKIMRNICNLKKSKNVFVNYDKDAIYVEPKFKLLVSYMERTSTNMLRQPFVKSKKA